MRLGTSRFEPTADGKRAIGTINGQDFIAVEIRSVPECEATAGLLNYPGLPSKATQVVVNEIPFVCDFCKAEPVSVNVNAPAGDAFASYPIAKVVWAAEMKNGSFSFSPPKVAGR